jgi:pyocin large subunit-like protein
MRRSRLIYLFLAFITLCSLSCSKEEPQAPVILEAGKGYVSSVQAGNFAPGQLEAHYQKHGYQFGNISQEEYLAGARALLGASPDNDVFEKKRPNGDILHYRASTGEFAVMASDGRIKTYFKTDYGYWLRQ